MSCYGAGYLDCEGTYDVITNPQLGHTGLHLQRSYLGKRQHDGAQRCSSLSECMVWICPGHADMDYIFTCWVTAVVSASPPILQFNINGNSIGPVFNSAAPPAFGKNMRSFGIPDPIPQPISVFSTRIRLPVAMISRSMISALWKSAKKKTLWWSVLKRLTSTSKIRVRWIATDHNWRSMRKVPHRAKTGRINGPPITARLSPGTIHSNLPSKVPVLMNWRFVLIFLVAAKSFHRNHR